VGTFREPGNVARLVMRLRQEGFGPPVDVLDEPWTLFRVIASVAEGDPGDGQARGDLGRRLRALGFAPDPRADDLDVTGLVRLGLAVESAQRLRRAGIPVRIEQEAGVYRVVRVGAYASPEEAEQARRALVARGFAGVVTRDP
jgi:hypothetical protein